MTIWKSSGIGNNAFMVESDKVTSVNSMEDIMDLNRQDRASWGAVPQTGRGNL